VPSDAPVALWDVPFEPLHAPLACLMLLLWSSATAGFAAQLPILTTCWVTKLCLNGCRGRAKLRPATHGQTQRRRGREVSATARCSAHRLRRLMHASYLCALVWPVQASRPQAVSVGRRAVSTIAWCMHSCAVSAGVDKRTTTPACKAASAKRPCHAPQQMIWSDLLRAAAWCDRCKLVDVNRLQL
jgi:hypothetical protein